jgi:hypothetical protein
MRSALILFCTTSYMRVTPGSDPDCFLHLCGPVAGFFVYVRAISIHIHHTTSFLETVVRLSCFVRLNVSRAEERRELLLGRGCAAFCTASTVSAAGHLDGSTQHARTNRTLEEGFFFLFFSALFSQRSRQNCCLAQGALLFSPRARCPLSHAAHQDQ